MTILIIRTTQKSVVQHEISISSVPKSSPTTRQGALLDQKQERERRQQTKQLPATRRRWDEERKNMRMGGARLGGRGTRNGGAQRRFERARGARKGLESGQDEKCLRAGDAGGRLERPRHERGRENGGVQQRARERGA
ncbi:hypothetical protein DENSPDRAFT_688144 [Dentipellis sp. KUC8613]|nr:hypothetical protein DENSPDRAFT_688144 [Dentipellis sp. KUC8613]